MDDDDDGLNWTRGLIVFNNIVSLTFGPVVGGMQRQFKPSASKVPELFNVSLARTGVAM